MVTSTWIEELEEPCLRLTEMLEFGSPLDINVRRSPKDGRFYFLEVNCRTSSNLMLDTAFGLNLPAITYRDTTGEDITELVSKTLKTGGRWINEAHDWQALVHGRASLLEYAKSLKNSTFGFFDPSDPMPFFNFWRRHKKVKGRLITQEPQKVPA